MWWLVAAGVLGVGLVIIAVSIARAPIQNQYVRFFQSGKPGEMVYNCDACGAAGLIDVRMLDADEFDHRCDFDVVRSQQR